VAHNTLDDTTVFNASPAVSDGRFLLRSDRYLYCLGKKQTGPYIISHGKKHGRNTEKIY
jgi:hypothetical protein